MYTLTRLVWLRLALLASACSFAAAQQLVLDIDQGPSLTGNGSSPRHGAMLGARLLFSAADALGTELWETDGTGAGTQLVRDLNPGSSGSFPEELVAAGGRVFFTARVGNPGDELWVTDGTAGGTVLVADIDPVAGSSPSQLTPLGQGVVFTADDGAHGRELWFSDGTAAGTQMLRDIRSGTSSSSPFHLVAMQNGNVLFVANDGVHGSELWITDGTPAGTTMVLDLRAGAGSGVSRAAVVVGAEAYFVGNDGTGDALWRSDGTAVGTWVAAQSSQWIDDEIAAFGGHVYYSPNSSSGDSLWRIDGTTGVAEFVADANPAGTSDPEVLAVVGSTVYFSARPSRDRVLYAAVPSGGAFVLRLVSHTIREPRAIGETNGGQVFTGLEGVEKLFFTDGTTTTTLVTGPSTTRRIEYLGRFGQRLLLAAEGDANGHELWETDGTLAGTRLLADIYQSPPGASPRGLMALGPRMLFQAAWTLWTSDGTAAGTVDLGIRNDDPPLRVGERAYFTTYDAATGRELWVTDGTLGGTVMIADLNPGSANSNPSIGLAAPNGEMYFSAETPALGRELWATDGTAAGTRPIGDFEPGPASSWAGAMVVLGSGEVLVEASTASTGYELFAADPRAATTRLVRELVPGTSGIDIWWSRAYAGGALMALNDRVTGEEPWFSDGTAAGTYQLADINPTGSSSPSGFVEFGGLAYFTADDGGTFGRELWVTDGTIAGTRMVADATPGPAASPLGERVVVGDRIVFVGSTAAYGQELWISDGTAANTGPWLDLLPGPLSSRPRNLTAIGADLALFTAADDRHGFELWVTDGTAFGTRMLADLRPGPAGAEPGEFALWALCPAAPTVFFGAFHPTAGRELWSLELEVLGGSAIEEFGNGCATGAVPALAAFGRGGVGEPGFGIELAGAPPLAPTGLLLSFHASDFVLGACRWLVGAPDVALGATADASGAARYALAVPNDPTLSGLRFFAQGIVPVSGGALLGLADLTAGLGVVIGR